MLKTFLVKMTVLIAFVDLTKSALATKRREDIFSVTVPVVTEPTHLQKTTTEEQPQKDEAFYLHRDQIALLHKNDPNIVLPPPPAFDPRIPCPVPYVIGGPPNCQCFEKGRCPIERFESTKVLLPKTDLVCGLDYEPCCFENSQYPGQLDEYEIKCLPQEKCTRSYGQAPTDIADFGIFPPCPGTGAVRCLDHLDIAPFIQPPIVHYELPAVLPAIPAFPPILIDHELKCVHKEKCMRNYGQSPTDVAKFGNIPPCLEYDFVRCLDHLGVAPFIPANIQPFPPAVVHAEHIQLPPVLPAIPALTFPAIIEDYPIKCVHLTDCVRSYGQSPIDIAEFGTFPPCPQMDFVRCLDHLKVPPFIPPNIQIGLPLMPTLSAEPIPANHLQPITPIATVLPQPPPFDPRVPCPAPYVVGGLPNCQCVLKGYCPAERLEDTKILLSKVKLACGFEYEGCCFADSPYQGIYDDYALECVPQETCTRNYGQSPTDIAEFGVFPPCPGSGAVRCLDHLGVTPFIPQPSVPVISVPAPPALIHHPDNYMLECVPVSSCIRRYGQSPIDVAEFGQIPPCLEYDFVRCLDPVGVKPFIPQPSVQFHPVIPAPAPHPAIIYQPDNYMLECIPVSSCTRSYGQSPTDVAEFGQIPPCPLYGFVRCLNQVVITPQPVIPEPPPTFIQPSYPIQPQVPIIEEIPQPAPTPIPAPTQEIAPFYPARRVYPYLGFRVPIIANQFTTFGAPLGGVYGAPIPSRIGQYGFNGLTNFGFPLAPLFSGYPGFTKQLTFGL